MADDCAHCGGRSRVRETRESGDAVRRRRECLRCARRWTTVERRVEDDAERLATRERMEEAK